MKQPTNQNFHVKHKFVVREATFKNNFIEGQGFSVKPKFSKKITKLSENEFDVTIKVEIISSENNPFPFNLSASISLISLFDKVNVLDEPSLNEYLNVTCIQILFPYLRSVVTSLTNAGMVTPLVLPIINAKSFADGDNA